MALNWILSLGSAFQLQYLQIFRVLYVTRPTVPPCVGEDLQEPWRQRQEDAETKKIRTVGSNVKSDAEAEKNYKG